MIIPVRCFTCGKVLGNKWDAYLRALEKENGQRSTVDGTDVKLPDNFDKALTGKVLDDLHITRMCCRRHMICNVDLLELL